MKLYPIKVGCSNPPAPAKAVNNKINPANGKMLGRFEVRAHELSVAPDDTLLTATRGSQLLLVRLRT